MQALSTAVRDHRHGRLREVMRGEGDAPLRQIEAKRVAHGPAQPGIRVRLWRPDALDQTAEHDAVGALQAPFQRTVDAHARARELGPAHDAPADCSPEQLDVVGRKDGEIGLGRHGGNFIE